MSIILLLLINYYLMANDYKIADERFAFGI